MPLFLLPIFLGLWSAKTAYAVDPRFEDHRTGPVLETCARLDFTSTSLSRNHEERILARNPGGAKPNFGGKYLILNLPLMMEDLWLIADCADGKFLKPTLDGKASFRPDSLLLELKTKEGTEWQVWTNGGWSRIGAAAIPGEPRVTAVPATRTGAPASPCLPPDFTSFFKADAVRDNLLELNPGPGHANYAGHYRILKNELLFDTRWFLLDCRTGKFEKEVLSASRAEFSAGGDILTLTDEGKFPRRLRRARGQWVETPDPEHPDRTVRNLLEGSDARRLYALLPNPDHHDRVEFEDLVCEKTPHSPASLCRIRLLDKTAAKEPHPFKADENPWISEIVRDFGFTVLSPRSDVQILGIRSGFCQKEKSRCELESGAGKLKP